MAQPTRDQLVAYARQVAAQYGVDPDVFVRQIDQESGFNPNAKSSAGAQGIAQLMPSSYPNVDASDPYASLQAAAQTDAQNLKRYAGDYSKMLAAYNAGAGAVDQYGGVPPYAETQRYVKAILGDQGGSTMAQNQDSSSPDVSSIIDQVVNGNDPNQPAGAAASTGGDTTTSAASASGTPQMNGNDILSLIVGKLGPPISVSVTNPTVKDTSSVLGGTVPNRQPTYRYMWSDGKYLDVAALDSGAVVKGGTALTTLSSGTTPDTKTFPDGSLRQYDPDTKQWTVIGQPPANKTDAAPKTIKTADGSTYGWDPNSGQWSLIQGGKGTRIQIHQMPDGSLASYDPDTQQWTQVQPRYVDPAEQAYKQALTAEASANAQKTQLGLRPTALAAIQDAYATIAAIQQKIASGQMTPAQGTALADQVHQGLSATLAGTTLFEQQKQAQDMATQRAQIADSLVNQRVSSAASLGSSLFNAAVGHVLMPVGKTTLGINPLAIANQEVNAMGGGQVTSDAASAFLRSVLGGTGQNSGTNVQSSNSQFPMTREDVLAQYPELAQMGQPAQAPQAAPFIPPNLEQGAGVMPPPPQPPMSPTNQLMTAGG